MRFGLIFVHIFLDCPNKVKADNDGDLLYSFELTNLLFIMFIKYNGLYFLVFFINFMLTNRSQASTTLPFSFTTDDATMSKPLYKWRRVLLKVSGEALAGDHAQNIDPKVRM